MGCCGLAKYCLKEVAAATALAAVLCSLAFWKLPVVLAVGVAAVPVVVWAWLLWFFRDPRRDAPSGDGLIVSPADGAVTDITPIGPRSVLGREGTQIGIFMSIFSVHVNRSPADAVVRSVEHKAGSFLDARDAAAGERNESATIFLTHERRGQQYPLVVRQVAGLLARRIVTDLAAGQSIRRGQRIGMIKLGSRLELLLPRELAGEVLVQVGQNVKAGLTVLARAAEAST
ncbi:MAG: phosphatidylserine decarboxylase [Phycisphaerae bacterium]